MISARVEKCKKMRKTHYCILREKLCSTEFYVKNHNCDNYASAIYYCDYDILQKIVINCDFSQFLVRKPYLLAVVLHTNCDFLHKNCKKLQFL